MSTQLRNQETATKAAPSPAQNQFQARPFVEEAEAESRSNDSQQSIGSNTSAPPDTPIQPKPNALTGHFFNRVPLHANPVQPKLTIGQPNDQYEQEADQVADRVMKMAAPPDHPSIQRQTDESWMQPMRITPLVQRQVEDEDLQMQSIGFASSQLQRQAEDEPEALQLKPLMGFVQRQEEEDMGTASPLLQRFAAQAPTQQPDTQTSSLENQLSRRQGGGSPLPEDVRAFMEPRFGYDFSHVRVHTDSEAVQMNRDVSAQAFTHRNDIYFNAGTFNANSDEGKTLLAHELTHVVQQTGGKTLQRRSLSHLSTNKETLQTKISASPHAVLQRKEAPKSPEDDPAFQKVHDRLKGAASKEKTHPPAKTKAKEAQAAATPPAGEVDSKAKDRQVQEMAQQQPGQFNAAAFKAALMQKIADAAPKNLKEADEFKQNNKLDSVKGDVSSKVKDEKKQAAGSVEQKTKEAPDASGITPKSVTPLKPEQAGAPPANLGAAQAAPKPKDSSEISLQQGSQELDQQMQESKVTNEQLAGSGESTFVSALDAKKESQAHAHTAPAQYRQEEQGVLGQAQAEAQTTAESKTKAMHGDRKGLLAQVVASQTQTKGVDEQKRAEVTNHIQGIYNTTKQKVETRLSKLDEDVAKAFDQGADAAKTEAVNYIDSRMSRYKYERYLVQIGGSLLWIKDQFMDLPSEVNVFYEQGRNIYLDRMNKTIDKVANTVSTELNAAKADINAGKKEIQTYVAGLDPALQKVGQQAAQTIQNQFKELEQSVDSKQNELIDSLAQKYNEKLQEMDASIDEMKAANRGLVNKAKDAIGGVIKTILELKNMLMGVLAKAAGAIEKIIKDPIGFLGNLVSGIKKGFQNFVSNIWSHLKKGLIGWLVGALAGGGIQLPESFDLKGIFSLVMQVLGLAYEAIRPKLVAILGEKVVAALEKSFTIIKILITEGVAGLWNFVKDKVGDLKTMVMDGIQNFVIDSVIKQGVMWVLSLLNPASAFVKACKMIYDVIMFFIERGSQIIELVNAVTDSVAAIANGAIDAAAGLVENALAKALPVVISFMASLLGLSGISEKIQEIIKKVRGPIDKAIDWLIGKAVAFAKKLGKKLGFGKKKDDKKDPKTKADVDKGIQQLHTEETKYAQNGSLKEEDAQKVASTVRKANPVFKSISVSDAGDKWKYDYVIQKADEDSSLKKAAGLTKKLQGLHDSFRRKVTTIDKLWKQGKIKKELDADSGKKSTLEAEKTALEESIKLENPPESDYQKLKSGDSSSPTSESLQEKYEDLNSRAEKLEQTLMDLTKNPEELDQDAAQLRKQIKAAHARATEVMSAPDASAALSLATYTDLKNELTTGLADVASRIAADAATPKKIDDLRLDFTVADKLRRAAERAAKLKNIGSAAEPWIEKIDNIVLNTTAGGREAAEVGDGSTEAAAIEEARTGQPTKGRWHGPKCETEGRGLADAIRALKELRSQTSDSAVQTKIDTAISKAEARKKGLDKGADAWNGSPFKNQTT